MVFGRDFAWLPIKADNGWAWLCYVSFREEMGVRAYWKEGK